MSNTNLRVSATPETVVRQCLLAPVCVTIAAATARSAQLAVGSHYVIATNDCYIRQGTVAIEAATTDHFLPYGVEIVIRVDNATTEGYIAAIGTSGTLQIRKVESL